MGTVEFVRGRTSGIASKALKDGQILFDKDNRTIALDGYGGRNSNPNCNSVADI